MSKIEHLLSVTLSQSAISEIERRLGVKASTEQVLCGLASVTRLTLDQLAEEHLDVERLVSLYAQSIEFALSPQALFTVHLDESIIPEGTQRGRLDQLVKHKGEIWVIHRNDADPYPSCPHAHNYEANLKLHLGTGDLYLGRRITGNIGEKALGFIRSQLGKFTLPPLTAGDA